MDYDGGNTDRQRIELKGHNKSSEDILGREGDIITYNWKFYLPEDLVETPPPGFFHVFQIKAIDGGEAGAPIFTFTVTGEELLFRNVRIGADMSTIEVIDRMPVASALGRWLEADVTIQYRDNGYVSMSLTDADTGEALMSGSGPYDCWRRPEYKLSDGSWAEGSEDAPVTQRTRPKWGLYRSIGRPDSGTVVADATMYFGDLNIIKRNPETYLFDDGYDPKEAGEIPNRKPNTFTWTDGLTADDVKAGYSYGAGIVNLFDGTSSRWDVNKNILSQADQRQVWVAVDLGEERDINQISLSFNGGNAPKRLSNVTMAYTSNGNAYDELVNNTTPYPLQTANGSAWVPFLNTNGSPSKDKTFTLEETITARYVILLGDINGEAAVSNSGSIQFTGWQLRYEESPARPLNIVVTSPVSGDDVGSGAFVISGEISNILSFEKLSPVEVLNQNKEVVASAAAVQSENDPAKAVYSVQVPAPAEAGEYRYTVSVSEPDKVEGSLRIDKAAVTVSAQGVVEDVDNNYSDSSESREEGASSGSEELPLMVLDYDTENFQIKITPYTGKTAAQKEADTMTPKKLLAQASSIAPELANLVDLESAVVLSAFDLTATGKQPSSSNPLKVRFRLSGLQSNQRALVFHQMKNGQWELVGTSGLGAKSVWATFTSLSPVTILAVNAGTTAQTAAPAAGVTANPSTGAL